MAGCNKCKNGYIYIPKEVGIGYVFEICNCYAEAESFKKSRELLQKSNISPRLIKRYNLTDWESPRELNFEKLLSFIDNEEVEGNWLFLHGNAGTGKTYMSIILAWVALLREKSVYFSDVVSLLEDLRPTNPDAHLVLNKCKAADILILDDIGHEKSSQWVRERLYLIINNRYNGGKITIFTSNFPLENLRTTVSEAVYSRVKGESLEIHLDSVKDKRINI